MFSRIKEFNKNYSNIFFLVALLFIVIVLIYTAFTNKPKEKECVVPNKIVNNYNNYTYNIKYEKENEKIDLYVKRYGSKYLIEKNYNDTKTMYYIEYIDLLIKNKEEKYIKYNGNIIDDLDNRFLILDYVNDLSISSNYTSKNERACYLNTKNNLSICINLDNSIELTKDDIKILYTINNIGENTDFTVNMDKSITYQEEIIEENNEIQE